MTFYFYIDRGHYSSLVSLLWSGDTSLSTFRSFSHSYPQNKGKVTLTLKVLIFWLSLYSWLKFYWNYLCFYKYLRSRCFAATHFNSTASQPLNVPLGIFKLLSASIQSSEGSGVIAYDVGFSASFVITVNVTIIQTQACVWLCNVSYWSLFWSNLLLPLLISWHHASLSIIINMSVIVLLPLQVIHTH